MNKVDLGYYFYPPKNLHDPGHPQMDIILRDKPTFRHFDPERAEVPVYIIPDGAQTMKITHPCLQPGQFQLYPGRVVLHDRLGKSVAAFTFGGDLEIEEQADQTLCRLTSEAPIYDLPLVDCMVDIFVQEVEILLAERRAAWAYNPDELEHRLASQDPCTLFSACIQELSRKFDHIQDLDTGSMHEFLHYLRVGCELHEHTPQLSPGQSLESIY